MSFFLYRYPLGPGTDLTFNYSAPTNESTIEETFRYVFAMPHNHASLYTSLLAIVIKPAQEVLF